jgi:hypothetical protein
VAERIAALKHLRKQTLIRHFLTRYQSSGTNNMVASTIFTYDTVGESAS